MRIFHPAGNLEFTRMIGPLLWNSLLVAGGTSATSAVLGLVAAVAAQGLGPAARRGLIMAGITVLALPPFLVTNTWLRLLGVNGVWRAWLPIEIQSLPGTVFILAALMWPICFLLTLASWRRLESSQIESDAALRGLALFRHLLWPLARPYLLTGAIITFVLALNNFTVPAILQIRVLPASLWIHFNTTFDYGGAWRVGWPLLIIPCGLLLVLFWKPIQWPRTAGDVSPRRLRNQLGGPVFGICVAASSLLLGLSLAVPLGQLVASPGTWAELPVVLRSVPATVWNSFAWPALTATACLVLGGLTWRIRWGWLIWLPFLVPGIWLGIALIEVFNRPFLRAVYTSSAMVTLAWMTRYAAPGWVGWRLARLEMDRDLADTARLYGGWGWLSGWKTLGPLLAPMAAAIWYVTYLLCLWDVETLVLIVPPGGETLALRVFNLLHYGHNAQVNAMCLLLIMLALTPALLWQMGRWLSARWRNP